MSMAANAQIEKCRSTHHFYHLAHGSISGWIDQLVLDGSYTTKYVVRQHITRVDGYAVAALANGANIDYLIQSQCRAASPKGSMLVMLIHTKTNTTQYISYPMGSNNQPFTLISNRGEAVWVECVDQLLFAFNILLKGSTTVIARVRNIRIPAANRNGIKSSFTLEVEESYKPITSFLIATALAIDEYSYPSSVEQKRKHCQ